MKRDATKRLISIFTAAWLLGGAVPLGYAQGGVDYGIEISQKFGRGLVNVLSSPAEIPCTMRDEVKERGAAGVGTGFFLGTWYFVRRVLVGVTEVGTFMIPMEATIPPVCSKRAEARLE